jgi:hypothetical protein
MESRRERRVRLLVTQDHRTTTEPTPAALATGMMMTWAGRKSYLNDSRILLGALNKLFKGQLGVFVLIHVLKDLVDTL